MPTDNGASDKPRLLTAAELADRLNVSVAFVYRYRGPGRIVLSRTLVRFDYDQVVNHLATGQVAS